MIGSADRDDMANILAWANASLNGAAARLVNVGVCAAFVASLPAPSDAADSARILALGDSLTAGYGLVESEGFTAQLERALRDHGYEVEIVNAGVSGDTTRGGLSRLDWALADDPDLVLLELGANDGLRGIDPADTRANLEAILRELSERGIPTLLAGMYAPPNLGPEYGAAFNSIYPELAREFDVPLYPFFLEGVAAVPSLNQADGIHPNADGVATIVSGIMPHVIDALESAGLTSGREG